MLHDIFYLAMEDIAKTINGIDFYIQIFPKAVQLSAVDVMMGIQIILSNAPALHRLPKTVISDHAIHLAKYT